MTGICRRKLSFSFPLVTMSYCTIIFNFNVQPLTGWL